MKSILLKTGTLFCIVVSSCNVAYRSTMVHTPMFTSKNQLAISGASNNLQVAYSAGNHVGIMANGFYEEERVGNSATGNGGYGYLGELGAGYFTGFSSDPRLIFETYAGAGFGHLYLNNNYRDNNDIIQMRTLNADAAKFFIQPALGFKLPYFEVSGAIRYNNINYSNVTTSNWPATDLTQSNLDQLAYTTYHFVEPALTLRGGIKNIKLQFQYLYCIKLNPERINYNNKMFSVGIILTLPVDK